MKHLSRFLSLVLVVALSLSLIVVAGAVDKIDDYADRADITDEYVEAVDVLTALQVLEGYEDGTLKPTSNVTRAEAAKLVAYISIGTTAAKRLAHRPSSFSDVVTDGEYWWANPFIEYAVERGIINGIGNGKFNPAGPVTGAQFAKLMLTALGYGAKGEYVGSSWELNSVVDGQKRGILTVDTDYSEPATREQVAQYTFNTISPINPTGRNYLVKFSNIIDDYVLANSNNTLVAIGNTGSEEFLGEETFGLLARTSNDNYGYAGHFWALAVNPNKFITGFYKTDVVLGENKFGVPVSALTDRYNPTYIAPPSAEMAYYINGTRIDNKTQIAAGPVLNPDGTIVASSIGIGTGLIAPVAIYDRYFVVNGLLYRVSAGVDLSTSGLNFYATALSLTRPGVIVTLVDGGFDRYSDFPEPVLNNVTYRRDFYAFDGAVDAVIIIEKTVHDVASPPIVAANGDVRIPGVVPDALHADQIDYPKDLVSKDVVLKHTDAFRVTHIEKAASVTGRMTYINRTASTATVEGNIYGDSGLVGSNAPLFDPANGYAHDTTYLNLLTTLYLDDAGFAVRAYPAEPIVPPTYGFVLGFDLASGPVVSTTAWVRLLDNTNAVKVLQVASKPNGAPDIDLGTWSAAQYNASTFIPVKYTMKNDLVAIEALPAAAALNSSSGYTYAGKTVSINFSNSFGSGNTAITGGSGPYYITSDTAILYTGGTTETTKVLKGYSATRDAVYTTNVSGRVIPGTRNLEAVYFNIAPPAGVASNYFFLADGRVDATNNTINPVFEYIVYVDGVRKTIKTLDVNLFRRNEIESSITGLYVYDGNNEDVKTANLEWGASYYGVVDQIRDPSGTSITYLNLDGSRDGIVCTPTTAYYRVTYYDPFTAPYLEGGLVEAGLIGETTESVIFTVEGVEYNSDGSAKAVYFTETSIASVNAYMTTIIDRAQAYNNTLNIYSATPHGVPAITLSIDNAVGVRNAIGSTRAQKLSAAAGLRNTLNSYVISLNAAVATHDAAVNGTVHALAASVSRADVQAAIIPIINGTPNPIPLLFSGASGYADAFTWSSNNVVVIKFADGRIVTWALQYDHP